MSEKEDTDASLSIREAVEAGKIILVRDTFPDDDTEDESDE
jgi:hypothetical protein